MTRGLALVLVTVAACRGDDVPVDLDATPGADGRIADATAPDAVPPDAMPAPVTVRARTSFGPFAGAPVVFFDAAGNVLADVTTDAAGEASAVVPPGGSVMAATSTASRNGFLWVSPEPGDVLDAFTGNGTATSVTTTVVVPAVGGSTSYRIDSECGNGSSSTASVTMVFDPRPECELQDFRVARAIGGGQAGSFYAPDQPVTADGTLDLSAFVYRDTELRTATVIGVPVEVTSVELVSWLHHNGHPIGTSSNTSNLTPAGGQVTHTFSVDDASVASLYSVASYTDGSSAVALYDLGSQADGELDATIAPSNLAAGAYADATDVLTWSFEPTGQAPQGVFAELHFGSPPSFASFGGDSIVWYVLAPPDGEVVMPAIPAQFTYLPVAVRPLTNLTIRAVRHSDGFGAVRTRAFGVEDPSRLVPAPGHLAISGRSFSPL